MDENAGVEQVQPEEEEEEQQQQLAVEQAAVDADVVG